MTLLNHALDYAASGVAIIPCRPGTKLPLTQHGIKDASTDPDVIKAWWRQWPSALIGATPPADMVVVDVDAKNGIDEATGLPRISGLDTWAALTAQHGAVETGMVSTGGGGLHLWFKTTGWAHHSNSAGSLKGRGIDVRGHGKGYVIMPPSIHNSGRPYEWANDLAPAECPDWLRKLITTEPKDTPPRPKPRDPGAPQGEVARAVERWNSDHPIAFERATRHRCPVCDDKGSFGPLKGDTSRWSCFSTDHPDDVGLQSNECFTGDALDLACHDRRLSRVDLLRQDGYLEDRPAPRRQAPEAPPPWLTDAPIPDDPGIWDSPDHGVSPPDEPPEHDEVAYRLASSGNVYVLTRGEWMLHHHTAAWQWCYEQNHMLDGKERSKAATHQSKTIPRAFSLDMDCTSKEPVVVRDGLPHLNTFRGIMEPGQPGDFSTICDHLNFMFGVDTEAQNWMLDWFATWYQPIVSGRGAFRSECMPLLYGTTGTGKGLLIRMLKHIVGARHTVKVKGSSIDDKFTPAGINNALLYVIDELNDPKSLDVIKTFITEPDPSKRDMHVAETGFRSNLNLLATSNLIRPIQLAADDRRIAVIRLRESMPRDLATRIVDHERQGYPELPAFLRFLADRRIPAGVPMRPLDNADRDALITLSKPPHVEFLEDLRDLGAESVVSDYANAHPNMTLGRWHSTPDAAGLVSVGISTLAAAYRHWCNQRSKRAIDASLVISEASTVIPTARATSKTGTQGIQVKIAGKNVRCIAGVPLGGTGIAEQTEAAATEPPDWQLPPSKMPPNRA